MSRGARQTRAAAWSPRHTASSNTEAHTLTQAHRFDIVPVRVEQKRGVVRRAVVGAQARTAIVSPTGFETRCVEAIDCCMIGRSERDVYAARCALGLVPPQRGRVLRAEPSAGLI